MQKNSVELIGFLGKDGQVKQSNNSNFTLLSVATKESWKNKETAPTIHARNGMMSSAPRSWAITQPPFRRGCTFKSRALFAASPMKSN